MNKTKVGSLLFMKDSSDSNKKRPYICIYEFSNNAGVAYDWLVEPITSKNKVGMKNLVRIHHPKLSMKSYAKISNIMSISCNNNEIEVSKQEFTKQSVRDVLSKLQNIFRVV